MKTLEVMRRLLETDTDWEYDPADPDELHPNTATDAARDQLAELEDKYWQIGFSISTADEFYIGSNLRDRGIEETDEVWEQINRDVSQLERNAVRLLLSNDFSVSEYGHDQYGLSGSLWVEYKNRKTFQVIKEVLDHGEPWSTGSGSIGALEGSEHLYDEVSDIGQQVLEVNIYLFADDEQKAEIENL